MYLPCSVTGTTRFLMILSTLPNEKKFSGQALCYTPRNFCQTLCYTHRAQCGTGQPLKVSLEYTTASSLCSRCFRMCYYARCRSDNLNQPEFSICNIETLWTHGAADHTNKRSSPISGPFTSYTPPTASSRDE